MCEYNYKFCYHCQTYYIHTIEGRCSVCCNLNYPNNIQFNYECPDCKGKFNTPAYVSNGTSAFVWKCPFCGRKLEGLN